MKNKSLEMLTAITLAILLFAGYTAFSLRHTEKSIEYTGIYTERQVNSAMNTVARYFTFNFLDCKLLKLYTYDADNFNENELVILADFYVGTHKQLHPMMVPDSVHTRRQFHMKKVCGIWIVTDNGYA